MSHIVLVEDEHSIAEGIVLNLELEGYTVTHIDHGGDAYRRLSELATSQLVILDVMLPEMDGITICEHLRAVSQVPVLFLSAKGTTEDKIQGLRSGGTDYLSKPFDLEELLLRVQILIQRNPKSSEKEFLQIGSKTVDFHSFLMKDEQTGEEHSLSKREIALLQLLTKKAGEVVSRDEILDTVWGTDEFPNSRTIDNMILNFRKWFEINPKEPHHFHSVRGVGYRFTF